LAGFARLSPLACRRNAFRLQKRLRVKTHFVSHFNPITLVQILVEKYFASLPHPFEGYSSYPASSMRGVRVVTNVEAGCDGRGRRRETSTPAADGEVVWSWHPDADAKLAVMRIKHHAGDGGQKARRTGESAK
jgi:hypothetical protein